MNEFITGTIEFFNNERGFGFAGYQKDGEEKSVFLHFSGLAVEVDRHKLQTGSVVEFQVEEGRKGKGLQAVNMFLKEAQDGE